MRTHRDPLMGIVRVRLVASTAVVMFLSLHSLGCQRGSSKMSTTDFMECRVSFLRNEGEAFAEISLDNKSLIQDLVLQPMREATRDLHPAAYAALGNLTITTPDGRREVFHLYAPWGHYSDDHGYWMADFRGLQAACEDALREAQLFVDAAKDTTP
jgi:hypothetical protein